MCSFEESAAEKFHPAVTVSTKSERKTQNIGIL
jgi:hypothetical protein